MELGLKGKVALVTGGSQGIGLGIGKILAQEGAEVILASRSEDKLKKAADTIKQYTDATVHIQPIDMRDQGRIESAISEITSRFPIDILINNTGGPPAGKQADLSLEDWDQGYHELLRSLIVLSKLVIPKMTENKWGRILTITSTAAKELIPQLPISATFRSGIRAWTKSLAKEVGSSNILVNNLLPGLTNTSRLVELEEHNPTFFKKMTENVAVGKLAEPEDMGKIAAFLVSDANRYITGTDILADGGYTHVI